MPSRDKSLQDIWEMVAHKLISDLADDTKRNKDLYMSAIRFLELNGLEALPIKGSKVAAEAEAIMHASLPFKKTGTENK